MNKYSASTLKLRMNSVNSQKGGQLRQTLIKPLNHQVKVQA